MVVLIIINLFSPSGVSYYFVEVGAVAVLANIPSITLNQEVFRECTDVGGDQQKETTKN